MMSLMDTAPPALAGIAIQEAVHWYKLTGRLDDAKVRGLLLDWMYWAIVFFYAVFGTIAIYYLVRDKDYLGRDLLLMGIALPSLVRSAISGATERHRQDLGHSPESTLQSRISNVARNYFR